MAEVMGVNLSAILPLLPFAFGYVLIVKGVDRYDPKPWWILSVCLAWGAITALIAPRLLGAASQIAGESFPMLAPLVEELSKASLLIVLWLVSALWLGELDSALEGLIYGGMIGVGSALGAALALGQATLAGLIHITPTAITGLGIGIAAEARGVLTRAVVPLGCFALAVLLNRAPLADAGSIALTIAILGLLYVLALRERNIRRNNLRDEAGVLLDARELGRMTSFLALLPFWNSLRLLGSAGGYRAARRKQILLARLASMKHRKRLRPNAASPREEWLLRDRIVDLNKRGVFMGRRV